MINVCPPRICSVRLSANITIRILDQVMFPIHHRQIVSVELVQKVKHTSPNLTVKLKYFKTKIYIHRVVFYIFSRAKSGFTALNGLSEINRLKIYETVLNKIYYWPWDLGVLISYFFKFYRLIKAHDFHFFTNTNLLPCNVGWDC